MVVPFAGRQPPVHTQPFAFRAPQEDHESVKISNIVDDPFSILLPALRATHPSAVRLQKRQFLFDTNKPFGSTTNFSTHTKQSTSFFLFDTNESSPVTTHRSQITTHESRKNAGTLGPKLPCRLTLRPRLRTMRRMQRKRCPGAPANI